MHNTSPYALRSVVFCTTVFLLLTGIVKASLIQAGKLDSAGRYQRLLGVTIISMLEKPELISSFSDFLHKPHISKCIAPLPISSYHMTVFPLETQWELGYTEEEWDDYMSTPEMLSKMQQIQKRLEERPLKLRPYISGVAIGSAVVALKLEIPDEQIAKVVDFQTWVANVTGLKFYADDYTFHVSLGYWYDFPSQELYLLVANGLNAMLEQFCAKFNPCELRTKATELVSFESMQEFVPYVPPAFTFDSNVIKPATKMPVEVPLATQLIVMLVGLLVALGCLTLAIRQSGALLVRVPENKSF